MLSLAILWGGSYFFNALALRGLEISAPGVVVGEGAEAA